ncbi:ACTL9 protein, partial [Bucco capensis]|nr:ACTL9 protein [Bucco capensis]
GAVVIDIGTRCSKAGFSGQLTPSAEISTLQGCPMTRPSGLEEDKSQAFIGGEAFLSSATEMTEPMQNGIIVNWQAAESLLQQLFEQKLQVPPEEYALLISEPPLSPSSHREKMMEVAFESLGSPGFFVAHQPVLATYAHGRTSGLVVNVGYAASWAVPVHEGYSLAHATTRMELAGSHLSWYLMTLLGGRKSMLSKEIVYVVEDMKHECCYVASNFKSECKVPPGRKSLAFALPDGKTITLNKERFQCPEVLFNPPPDWAVSYGGIHEMAQRSLEQVPEEIRSTLYKNIFLCGGSTLFEGLERRFFNELLQSLPPDTKVGVAAMPWRLYSAWTGGSILASLDNFQKCWIQRDEYCEEGPRIVHQRCY